MAAPVSVAILHWPAESRRLEDCRARGVPRLLLVGIRESAPICLDILEDWVRPPVSREDVTQRARTLLARARRNDKRPTVDGNDVIWCDGHWLALSALEARLMRRLAGAYGEVVERGDLVEHTWPDAAARPAKSLNLHIMRLRRRIGEIGLEIRTARGRGYALVRRDGAGTVP